MIDLLRRFRWLVLMAAAVTLVAFGLASVDRDLPEHALSIAPEGSRLIMEVHLGAVMGSPLWDLMLDEEEGSGVRRIERTCGYDPLNQVERAVVFLSGDPAHPFDKVGLVAQGEMARGRENRERLIACVEQVAGDEGGSLLRGEIEGEPAVSSAHGQSHAAFLAGDGVVGGDREPVASAIRLYRGEGRSAYTDEDLRRLWTLVGTDRDVIAVARLPERWLPLVTQLVRGMGDDLDAFGAVEAIGIGIRVRDGLAIGAAFQTGGESDATALEAVIQERVESLLADRQVRLSAAGGALRRIDTDPQGRDLVVTVALSEGQVEDLWALWRELRESGIGDDAEAAEPEGVEPEGVEPEGLEPEGTEPEGTEPEERVEPEGRAASDPPPARRTPPPRGDRVTPPPAPENVEPPALEDLAD